MHGTCPEKLSVSSRKLKVALRFSLLDALSPWLILFLYITKVDLVWAVNVNFLLLTAYLALNYRANAPSSFLNYLIFGAIILSLVKIATSIYAGRDLMISHASSYTYGLVMPLVALSFAKTVSEAGYDNIHQILCEFSLRYFYITIPTIIFYTILYFTGQVSYFGLGINVHYIYPFFLTGKFLPVGIFLIMIVLSGKRSVLINFFLQTFAYYGASIKNSLAQSLVLISALVIAIYSLAVYTTLLDRFSWIFSEKFDFSDPYFLLIAAGGRFEEVIGIQNYFQLHPLDVFFGSAPGAYYNWAVDLSDYNATKNYSHVTVFGYIFRYGLIFALPIYAYFLWQIVKAAGSRCPFYILFVGIFSSSLFGANLVIDPTSWIMIGLFLSLSGDKGDRLSS